MSIQASYRLLLVILFLHILLFYIFQSTAYNVTADVRTAVKKKKKIFICFFIGGICQEIFLVGEPSKHIYQGYHILSECRNRRRFRLWVSSGFAGWLLDANDSQANRGINEAENYMLPWFTHTVHILFIFCEPCWDRDKKIWHIAFQAFHFKGKAIKGLKLPHASLFLHSLFLLY